MKDTDPCDVNNVPRHGLHANKLQVALQLVLAVLIGASGRLVLLPAAILEDDTSKSDFLIFFGIAKALSGELGGFLSDRRTRKDTSLLGWICGAAIVPALLIGIQWKSSNMRNVAYLLLGAQQGLTWGVNIISLMDILGPHGRGMASAISNAVGYASSAATAPIAVWIIEYLGDEQWAVLGLSLVISLGVAVLALSRDTEPWIVAERVTGESKELWPCSTGCGNRVQALCSLAGLTVNTATGLVWGAMVHWVLHERGFSIEQVGALEAFHTAAKVIAMLSAGAITCFIQPSLVAATALVVLALGLFALMQQSWASPASWPQLMLASGLIGAGVGGAFPALAAAVTDGLPASSRASVYGAYRMWRDLGYAVGGFAHHLFDWDGFRSTSASVFALAAVVAILFGVDTVFRFRLCIRASDLDDVDTSSESSTYSDASSLPP